MKIAFIYDRIYPYVKGGGERRYYELSKRLCAEHEIHLWGMKFWQGEDMVQREDGVFLHGVCPPKEFYVAGRRSIYQAIYYTIKLTFPLLKEDFDLIECSSAPYFPIFICKLYSFVKRRPFIVAWLEFWGDYWSEYLGHWGWGGKWIEKIATKVPNHIIAISEHTKESLVKNDVRHETITAIPLGINLDEIEKVEPAITQTDLIFVGRLIKEKNVDVLIKVISELVRRGLSVTCCIIGDGPEKANLQNLCHDLGLENNISFHGFLDRHEDVYALMKSSKLFMFLSMREGFGLVVVEANHCGLPAVVIKAKHNAASTLVKNGENGFVCDVDVQEIANVVNGFLVDDAQRTRMKQAALAWAQQFDWNETAKRTEQVYQRVVAQAQTQEIEKALSDQQKT